MNLEGLEEDAIEVQHIVHGEVMCRIGFLQCAYIPHYECYHGKVGKVREIWTAHDESPTQGAMFHP